MRGVVRALSLEVYSKGFSFAVLQDAERLIDWGCRDVNGDVSVFLKKLRPVVERYRPDVLILEDPAGSRKGLRARRRLSWAEQYAVDYNLQVFVMSKERFAMLAMHNLDTKQTLSEAIARQFPELESLETKPRKPWESEPRSLSVFVAVARGCAALLDGAGR